MADTLYIILRFAGFLLGMLIIFWLARDAVRWLNNYKPVKEEFPDLKE